jgi:hypothetical protein
MGSNEPTPTHERILREHAEDEGEDEALAGSAGAMMTAY